MKLLVAAHPLELHAFADGVPGFDTLATGVGKLLATFELTRALERAGAAGVTYDEIVVIGTAGAIDESIVGGVYEVAAAIQHDVRDLDGVLGQHVKLPARIELAHGEGDIVIATGDSFVDDAAVVAEVRGLGAQMIDMESYAYAWVASRFGLPVRILKAVSDRAQDGATELWDDTAKRCSELLRDEIRARYGA